MIRYLLSVVLLVAVFVASDRILGVLLTENTDLRLSTDHHRRYTLRLAGEYTLRPAVEEALRLTVVELRSRRGSRHHEYETELKPKTFFTVIENRLAKLSAVVHFNQKEEQAVKCEKCT